MNFIDSMVGSVKFIVYNELSADICSLRTCDDIHVAAEAGDLIAIPQNLISNPLNVNSSQI